VALMFQYQSNRSLADFRGVLRRRLHGSILSRVGASGKAGAVHNVELLCLTHEELKRAALNAPSIYSELSAHINTRLGETTDKLLQLLFDDLEQRCYKSLVEITRLPDALTHPDCGFHADSDTHSTRIRTVIPR
ncbi:hypothetical protein AAIG96_33920, partial [Pseudomonas aeruginosa]